MNTKNWQNSPHSEDIKRRLLLIYVQACVALMFGENVSEF